MLPKLAIKRARRKAVVEAMAKGVSRRDAVRKLDAAPDEKVSEIVETECAKRGVALPMAGVGAIGDGSILAAINEFCEAHPELIKIIMTALLAFVGL